MADTNDTIRLHTIVEDVLLQAVINRQQRPLQYAMLGIVVGMTLAIENPQWCQDVLQEAAPAEKLVTTARRLAALRYAEDVDVAQPARPSKPSRRRS